MNGFIGVNLKEVLEQIGEVETKKWLSDFSCPLNPDVDYYIHNNAIEFSKQGISSTYVILASYQDKYVIVGYYSLANKTFCIDNDGLPSKNWRRRLAKFGQYDKTIKRYTLSAPLIGQLGKNYTNNYDKLITGDELLKLALDKVQEIQYMVGGKIVYLECEEKPFLLDFYSQNGFVNFGKRYLDKDETDKLSGEYLIQMLKYMK